MKHIFIMVLLFSLSMFSSCDDLSGEPRVNTPKLIFDANGGEQLVQIKIKKISWTFLGLQSCYSPNANRIEDYNNNSSLKFEYMATQS